MGLSPFAFTGRYFKVHDTPTKEAIGIEKAELSCEESRITVYIHIIRILEPPHLMNNKTLLFS